MVESLEKFEDTKRVIRSRKWKDRNTTFKSKSAIRQTIYIAPVNIKMFALFKKSNTCLYLFTSC